MGNELGGGGNKNKGDSGAKHQQHSIFNDYKKDVPVLTQTFNENATHSPIDEKLYLTKNDFSSKLFSKIPEFGVHLFKKYSQDGQPIDLYKFLKLSNEINSLCSPDEQLKYYISIFSQDGTYHDKTSLENLMKCAIVSSLTIAKISSSSSSSSSALSSLSSSSPSFDCDSQLLTFMNTLLSCTLGPSPATSANNTDTYTQNNAIKQSNSNNALILSKVTLEQAINWLSLHQAFCLRDLHDHVVYRLFKRVNVKKMSGNVPVSTSFDNNESRLWQSVIKGDSLLKVSGLWLLCSFIPHSFIPSSDVGTVSNFSRILEMNAWYILYNSNVQGLSSNGFSHKVLGYPGSTVTMIRFSSYLLVVGLDVNWKESHEKRGGYDCFMLQLTPEYKIITNNILYFNLTNRTIKKGVQLGADSRRCTLEIDGDFSNATYMSQKYELSAIEVWGCGGNSCFTKYCNQKAWEKKDTAKHQNRKFKTEDWKDNPDKMLLDYGGIETDHAKRGDL